MSETAQRAGHIPGAASVPWSQAVAEDGTFKSADATEAALRLQRHHRRQGSDRLLPYRRAQLAHVVRAEIFAGHRECPQLRRIMDGVGQPYRRSH